MNYSQKGRSKIRYHNYVMSYFDGVLKLPWVIKHFILHFLEILFLCFVCVCADRYSWPLLSIFNICWFICTKHNTFCFDFYFISFSLRHFTSFSNISYQYKCNCLKVWPQFSLILDSITFCNYIIITSSNLKQSRTM